MSKDDLCGRCTHPRRWHGQKIGDPSGSGACEFDAKCACPAFVEAGAAPNNTERLLADALAWKLNNAGSLAEGSLHLLEDHVVACRANHIEPSAEIVKALDGFRGKGKWPL